jgi:cytochrome c-type biogenesis protein CcmF
MALDDYILNLALFLAFLELISSILRIKRARSISFAPLVAVLSIIVFSLFCYHFLADHFVFVRVYESSNKALPIEYKLSALWTSSSGILLFWSAFHYSTYVALGKSLRKAREALPILSFLGVCFLAMASLSAPFATLDELPEDGLGLNPFLRNRWNVIHPPITFAGYALSSFPFAITLAKLLRKERGSNVEGALMGCCWVLFTLNLVTGAAWAYEAFGWGGHRAMYWAWDPVETASLLPWLACAAYFHGRTVRDKLGRGLSLMVVSTFVFSLLSTLTIMGAPIISAHKFVLRPTPQGIQLSVLLVMMATMTAIVYLHSEGEPKSARRIKFPEFLALISFFTLIGLSFLYALGVFYPMLALTLRNELVFVEESFFNIYSFPLMVTFLLCLMACSTIGKLPRKGTLSVVSLSVALGGVGLILQPTGNAFVDFSLPVTASTLVALLCAMVMDVKTKKWSFLFSKAVHVGLVVVLLGVFLSSTMRSEHGPLYLSIGESRQLGDVFVTLEKGIVKMVGVDGFVSREGWAMPRYYEAELTFLISSGGSTVEGSITCLQERGWEFSYASAFISRGLIRDVYVVVSYPRGVNFTSPNEVHGADVQVSVINFTSLLWVGSTLSSIAMLPLILMKER